MPTKRKGSLFRKAQPLPPPISTDPPCQFSVDARLPNPPILTRNQPIPLRLIVTKMSPTTQIAWLQMLQIELISYTRIRAHEFVRTEPSSTVILSLSNMNVPLGKPNDSVGQDWIIDSSLWKNLPVPPAVAPSFETCNISRHYELEVRVGLAPGSPGGGGPQVRLFHCSRFLNRRLIHVSCTDGYDGAAIATGCQGVLRDCAATRASGSHRCRPQGSATECNSARDRKI